MPSMPTRDSHADDAGDDVDTDEVLQPILSRPRRGRRVAPEAPAAQIAAAHDEILTQ